MKQILTLTILLTLLLSCNKKEVISNTDLEDSLNISKDSLSSNNDTNDRFKLETFSFPTTIEGCSCYFSENKSKFDLEQFIYVDDYGNNAYVKLNGNNILISMEEGDFDPITLDKIIENDLYKIIMVGKRLNPNEENMLFKGNLVIYNKKTLEKIQTTIYGECSC